MFQMSNTRRNHANRLRRFNATDNLAAWVEQLEPRVLLAVDSIALIESTGDVGLLSEGKTFVVAFGETADFQEVVIEDHHDSANYLVSVPIEVQIESNGATQIVDFEAVFFALGVDPTNPQSLKVSELPDSITPSRVLVPGEAFITQPTDGSAKQIISFLNVTNTQVGSPIFSAVTEFFDRRADGSLIDLLPEDTTLAGVSIRRDADLRVERLLDVAGDRLPVVGDSRSASIQELEQTLAAFQSLSEQSVTTSPQSPSHFSMPVGVPIDFAIAIAPQDRSRPTRVRVEFLGDEPIAPAERELPAGQSTTSIRETFTNPGRFEVRVTAFQDVKKPQQFDTLTLQIEETPADVATGQFVSNNGSFAIDHLDISYGDLRARGGGGVESRFGTLSVNLVPSRLPPDATLTIQTKPAVGASTLLATRTIAAEENTFDIDLESLIREQNPHLTMRLDDTNLVLRVGNSQQFDELQLTREDLQSVAARGLAPPSEVFPTPVDVDLVMLNAFTRGERGSVNVLLDNIHLNTTSVESGQLVELNVDFGDGSPTRSLNVDPFLGRDDGQINDGLMGILPTFFEHDFDARTNLPSSTFDRIFAHTYEQAGDFTITATASLPNGQSFVDQRDVRIRSGARMQVRNLTASSTMEVFARNDDAIITVAKSIPRVETSIGLLGFDSELAVPTVEVEIRGQRQKLPIPADVIAQGSTATLDFDQINLLDFVDVNANRNNRQVTVKVTVRDENGIFEDVRLETFTVEVPELFMEDLFNTGASVQLTKGMDTSDGIIYQITNLPLEVGFTVEPRVRTIVVNPFFVNLEDLSFPDGTLVRFALDHHFRDPSTGITGRPTDFDRVLGFAEDFAGELEIKAFQEVRGEQVDGEGNVTLLPRVSNNDPQANFVAALGSQIDVLRKTLRNLTSPSLDLNRSAPQFLDGQAFVEGDEVRLDPATLADLRAVNATPANAFGMRLLLGDGSVVAPELQEIASLSLDDFLAGNLRHRFADGNDGPSILVAQLLNSDGDVIDQVTFPIVIRDRAPTLSIINESNAIANLIFGGIDLQAHPLQLDGPTIVHVVRGRPSADFSPTPDAVSLATIQDIRANDPNAPILFVSDPSDADGIEVQSQSLDNIGDTIQLAVDLDANDFRNVQPIPFASGGRLVEPLRVAVESGEIATTESVSLTTPINPITFATGNRRDRTRIDAKLRRERAHTMEPQIAVDRSELEVPVANATEVGESLELSFTIRGGAFEAANNVPPGEEFELTVDLGDGRKLELFRDSTPESSGVFRVRENTITSVATVPFTTRGSLGTISLVDRSDIFRPVHLVRYSHIGRYALTVTTNVDEINEDDAFGEIIIDVVPKFDLTANADGSVSGQIQLGTLPSDFEVNDERGRFVFETKSRGFIAGDQPGIVHDEATGIVQLTHVAMGLSPGEKLDVFTSVPAMERDNVTLAHGVLIKSTVTPNPKTEIHELAIQVNGDFQQHSPLFVNVNLDDDSLAAANNATDENPFEMTISFGDGRTAHLSRRGSTPEGELRFGFVDSDAESVPVEYDVATGQLSLVRSGTANDSLVAYADFGRFTIQVATACGFGAVDITIENVIPTVVNPIATLSNDELRFEASVLLPAGGKVKVQAGENSAEKEVPASPEVQQVTLELGVAGLAPEEVTVTTSENESFVVKSVTTVAVTPGDSAVTELTGTLNEQGNVNLEITTLLARLIREVESNATQTVAAESLELDLGDAGEPLQITVSVQGGENGFAASASVSGRGLAGLFLEPTGGNLVVPTRFEQSGPLSISISNAENSVTGDFDVDVELAAVESFTAHRQPDGTLTTKIDFAEVGAVPGQVEIKDADGNTIANPTVVGFERGAVVGGISGVRNGTEVVSVLNGSADASAVVKPPVIVDGFIKADDGTDRFVELDVTNLFREIERKTDTPFGLDFQTGSFTLELEGGDLSTASVSLLTNSQERSFQVFGDDGVAAAGNPILSDDNRLTIRVAFSAALAVAGTGEFEVRLFDDENGCVAGGFIVALVENDGLLEAVHGVAAAVRNVEGDVSLTGSAPESFAGEPFQVNDGTGTAIATGIIGLDGVFGIDSLPGIPFQGMLSVISGDRLIRATQVEEPFAVSVTASRTAAGQDLLNVDLTEVVAQLEQTSVASGGQATEEFRLQIPGVANASIALGVERDALGQLTVESVVDGPNGLSSTVLQANNGRFPLSIPVSFPSSGTLAISIVDSNDRVVGASTVEVPPLVGDLNNDNVVDFADFLRLSQNFGIMNATAEDGDTNGDGKVDFADFLRFSAIFGQRRS